MSEQEIREGMLLAVWDEPPLDFDPDTLIKRVEQKKSRRRALVAVGVATAMIAVASLALPGLLPRDRESQLGADTPANSSAPPTVSVDKKAQQIGDQLARRLEQQVPDFRDIGAGFHSGGRTYPPYPTSNAPKRPDEPEFSGFVYFTDVLGPTAMEVVAGKNQPIATSFCQSAVLCHEVQQPDGSVVTEIELAEGAEISSSIVVRTFRSGYSVKIGTYNYNVSTQLGLRRTVPVRVGVLTALVTDPAINWE
ncbi:hypothetical protein SK854_19990 [Lentzea sp. BCCO 10_0061]|uniref:Uncharacterized protein n=1 Tax=Lentzea sokolovensis TaxID=3095429 RepID=A0ABU4UZJ6_9PSEU|nr:hypothetical protein [Lentzea sp. BCCO 10_0061]MDX8144409.1 hypothetical protein [Lentzea sp. BCCO 10_0061]